MRKFVMLNAHGGNSPLMTVVASRIFGVAGTHAGRRYELDAVWLPGGICGLPRRSARSASMAVLSRTSLMSGRCGRTFVEMERRQELSVRPKPYFARNFTYLPAPMAPTPSAGRGALFRPRGVVGNGGRRQRGAGEKRCWSMRQGPAKHDRGLIVRRVRRFVDLHFVLYPIHFAWLVLIPVLNP